jgi:hypothetical protein
VDEIYAVMEARFDWYRLSKDPKSWKVRVELCAFSLTT